MDITIQSSTRRISWVGPEDHEVDSKRDLRLSRIKTRRVERGSSKKLDGGV